MKYLLSLGLLSVALPLFAFAGESVWISDLDTRMIQQGWGSPGRDMSVDGRPLTISGKTFDRGLGTHAESVLYIELGGQGTRFSAEVGLDDEQLNPKASVEFQVVGDGRVLWASGVMRSGDAAKPVSVALDGVKALMLHVGDAGDGIHFDHADWAMARIEMKNGQPRAIPAPREEAVILTPRSGPAPRINGPKIYGCRPGHPFLYKIPVTGDRPMAFSAKNLPKGLQLDSKTGIITGAVPQRGETVVLIQARNAVGKTERSFKIVCGDRIALTPPMGWNSWNCFASAVTENHIKAAADAMIRSGLADHGWSYINIDDFWQKHRNSPDPTLGGPGRDANGRIVPNPRFPDMKGLCDYIHTLGLKAGIYSSPGPWTCGGCMGSFDHETLDAQLYGEWGIDYLKHDWCSYDPKMESKRGTAADFSGIERYWGGPQPQDRRDLMVPYAIMRAALDRVPRDIVYSLCQYGMGNVWEWGDQVGGNCWRTTGDITDTWQSMSGIGFSQAGHERFAGPGRWNDPDMLVVGRVGWGPKLHPTRLTPNEQYTHISLWCLLNSPLLIGCDMTQLDEFTLSLLTNDEVLEVNQDPLGRQAARVGQDGNTEVWMKEMEDGGRAVGLFNRGEFEAVVTARWSDLGLTGAQRVRDLWRQKDLGMFDPEFTANIPRHGAMLIRVAPVSALGS